MVAVQQHLTSVEAAAAAAILFVDTYIYCLATSSDEGGSSSFLCLIHPHPSKQFQGSKS
jgi:hypothetical protein